MYVDTSQIEDNDKQKDKNNKIRQQFGDHYNRSWEIRTIMESVWMLLLCLSFTIGNYQESAMSSWDHSARDFGTC